MSEKAPHDAECERTVLGAILVSEEALPSAQGVLRADDFYSESHRRIYAAMCAVQAAGRPVDPVTLKDHLVGRGEYERIGGGAYLARLMDGVPRVSNLLPWCQIIHGHALSRRLGQLGQKVYKAALAEGATGQELLDRTLKAVIAEAERADQATVTPPREALKASFLALDLLVSGQAPGTRTGLQDLDTLLDEMRPGQLICIGARPAQGKSALALQFAEQAVSDDKSVALIFTLEMTKEEVGLRRIFRDARVNKQTLRDGRGSETAWARIANSYGRLSTRKLWIDESQAPSVAQMRARARMVKGTEGRLDLIVVDYLQLAAPEDTKKRSTNREQEVAGITRALKGLAKDMQCPVLICSQLSRATEERRDGRPQLSDLRESGAIEQDCDVVMFIWREEEYRATDENRGIAKIIVAKQRNGPTGDVSVAFLKEYASFETLEWKTV